MTTTSTLYNLDAPDEQIDLDLKEADKNQIVDAAYKNWYKITENVRAKDAQGIHSSTWEPFYRRACKVIRPFKERLTGTLSVKDLPALCEKKGYTAGFYLSAVLNETGVNKLIVDDIPFQIGHLGYTIQPDKTIEIFEKGLAEVNHVGYFAKGGTIINHGDVWGMGGSSFDGIFINFGEISGLGHSSTGGIYLNYGTADNTLWNARNIVFVTKTHVKFSDAKNPIYYVNPKRLSEDADLSQLMNEIERTGRASDIPKVNKLARKVDAHVRKKYTPKRYKQRELAWRHQK